MTMFRPAIAAAVALVACLSTPAVAQDDRSDRIQVRIAYADLDLGTPAGRKTFQDRIDRTVRRACMTAMGGGRLTLGAMRCRDEMMRDAAVQVAAIPTRTALQVAARR